MEHLWGIDLGGTKTEGAVITNEPNPKTISRLRMPTNATGGYGQIIQTIQDLVLAMQKQTGLHPTRIGIGTPGTTNPGTGLLKNSNTTVLNGMPLWKDIEDKLQIPVVLENDANCFALAQYQFGAAAKHTPKPATVFGIIMGTGVGAGIIVNAHPLKGLHGIGGEWGHNVLDPNGPECYCGKKGCVETIISGPAMEKFFAHTYNRQLTLKQIAQNTDTDPECRATIEHLTDNFAKALANVLNILDPDAVVIGGGVGNIKELYSERTRKKIKAHLFNDCFNTPILPPLLGDSAGVFGAAALCC